MLPDQYEVADVVLGYEVWQFWIGRIPNRAEQNTVGETLT
jgi:hypothetical protein